MYACIYVCMYVCIGVGGGGAGGAIAPPQISGVPVFRAKVPGKMLNKQLEVQQSVAHSAICQLQLARIRIGLLSY